jgi:hypothetical protein
VEFGPLIAEALRQSDPRAFNQIARSGTLNAWMSARQKEAGARMREILAKEPRDAEGRVLNQNAVRCAEETVLADLTDFLMPLHPEPPNDLPMPSPRKQQSGQHRPLARTSTLPPARLKKVVA